MNEAFYSVIRENLFNGRLSQTQVDGIETLLEQWGETGYTNRQWLAYCLATAYHETAFTMQPIKERGGSAYFTRMYDITGERPHVARALGNDQPGDGVKFAGRGYVQITGRRNYKKASQHLGIDFVKTPNLVMLPENAAYILYVGCAEGWFTGKGLGDYITERQRDYFNARRVVNGIDKASQIADYALLFEAALDAGYAVDPINQDYGPSPLEETERHWITRLLRKLMDMF